MTVKQLRPILHIALTMPALYYAYRLYTADLGADPAEELNEAFGSLSIRLLLANLLWGILIQITKIQTLRKFSVLRRPLGVWTFFYVCLHIAFYFVKENDVTIAIDQIFTKLYLNAGAAAWVILGLLTLTSNDFFVRKLTHKKWKMLHRLAYASLYIAIMHYSLIEKADPRLTVIYGLPITLLYLFRVIQSRISSRSLKRPSN